MTTSVTAEKRSAALLALARVLGAERALIAQIDEALRAPSTAFEKLASSLALDGPVTDLAWLVLLRGLEANGRLRTIDWREFPGEAKAMLARLWHKVGTPPRDAWSWVTPELDDGKTPLASFLERTALELRSSNAALAYLDAGSDDDFALVIVSKSELDDVIRLARDAGYVVGTKLAKRPKPKSLFRPLPQPVPEGLPFALRGEAWDRLAVGMLPLASLAPDAQSRYTGNTLYGKGEHVIAHAKIVAWKRNEQPRSPAAKAELDHAILTSHRLVFALSGAVHRGAEPFVHFPYVEKKASRYTPSSRAGCGLLKVVDVTGTRSRGVWSFRQHWRWIASDEKFATLFNEALSAVPRAPKPR